MDRTRIVAPKTVSDMMSPAVVYGSEAETLEKAEADMETFGIRHLPVVDEAGHVLGIVSHRGVLRALARHKGGKQQGTLAQHMSRDVQKVKRSTPAADAAQLILDKKIGCVLVVDDDETLIGIVTETDFVRFAAQALRGG